MTMPVLSGRSVTFCSLLDLLLNGTIKIKVAEFDRRWFIVALFILIEKEDFSFGECHTRGLEIGSLRQI